MIRPVSRACSPLLILTLALLAGACGDSVTSPTSDTGTTTPTVSVTETIKGTLGSGGTNYHVFHTMPGVFTVTLATTDQSTNPALGMSFGMWDGKTCSEVLMTLSAVPTTAMTGTASVETDVCIKMWDPTPWDVSLKLSYSITAVHFAKAS